MLCVLLAYLSGTRSAEECDFCREVSGVAAGPAVPGVKERRKDFEECVGLHEGASGGLRGWWGGRCCNGFYNSRGVVLERERGREVERDRLRGREREAEGRVEGDVDVVVNGIDSRIASGRERGDYGVNGTGKGRQDRRVVKFGRDLVITSGSEFEDEGQSSSESPVEEEISPVPATSRRRAAGKANGGATPKTIPTVPETRSAVHPAAKKETQPKTPKQARPRASKKPPAQRQATPRERSSKQTQLASDAPPTQPAVDEQKTSPLVDAAKSVQPETTVRRKAAGEKQDVPPPPKKPRLGGSVSTVLRTPKKSQLSRLNLITLPSTGPTSADNNPESSPGSEPKSDTNATTTTTTTSSSITPKTTVSPFKSLQSQPQSPPQNYLSTLAASSPPLVMSQWEIAPGRITTPTKPSTSTSTSTTPQTQTQQTLAYSSAYLAQNQTISLSPTTGCSFRLLTLAPGTTAAFPAEKEVLRVCSVAQGIVVVRVRFGEEGGKDGGKERGAGGGGRGVHGGGEDGNGLEFQVGPNGMWKVQRGWAFTVVNPFHLGVAVHVTGILEGEDEL